MGYDNPHIQKSKRPYEENSGFKFMRSVYYGKVVSIDDPSDGGRIKVKIDFLDAGIDDDKLVWAYPLLQKHFHVFPQIDEYVRVFFEDPQYPQRGRFWMGGLVSQLPKIGLDSTYTALSTTDKPISYPEKAISTYPDAEGVFPTKEDIAIIGKVITDVILRLNEVHIRAGKHENNNVYKLNVKNPAQISLVFEENKDTGKFYSSNVTMADKIALITHDGNPKFKSAKLNEDDRARIFEEGHPISRGDVLVAALEIFRKAIINHIHGYSGKEADKNSIIKDLEKINLSSILQENVVTN